MTSTQDAIAAFLAKGGKVQAVESGVRTLSEREMYLARRGELSDNELIAQRIERAGVIYNGLGEIIGRL